MSPEQPVDGDWTKPTVDLPRLRSLGARQSVILVADDAALVRNLVYRFAKT